MPVGKNSRPRYTTSITTPCLFQNCSVASDNASWCRSLFVRVRMVFHISVLGMSEVTNTWFNTRPCGTIWWQRSGSIMAWCRQAPEPMLTYHQWGSVALTQDPFLWKCRRNEFVKWVWGKCLLYWKWDHKSFVLKNQYIVSYIGQRQSIQPRKSRVYELEKWMIYISICDLVKI